MSLESVDVGALDLGRFEDVLAAGQIDSLREGGPRGGELFAGRRVWNVNSTAHGGGVAEMLVSLLAYAHGAGVDARWSVIGGDEPFFAVTKRLHNHLHGVEGDGGPLGEDERRVYESALQDAGEALVAELSPRDVVIL